jgi:tRNA (guanine10-N2)-methyltransferase
MVLEMESDAVIRKVCERAVLVKGVYELWSLASTFAENIKATRRISPEFLSEHLSSQSSWCIQVVTFGKTYSMDDKQVLRAAYGFLDFQGAICLKQPDREFCVIVDYSASIHQEVSASPLVPTFFGRKVAGHSMKAQVQKYSLKRRPYLGPTSLDTSLAFILSNLACVTAGMLTLEPFVGTGSIAVALSHMQAFVMGIDIDPRVLRGDMYAGHDKPSDSTEKRDVRANFTFYDLQTPELVRMDAHLLDRHLVLPDGGLFQAIVTDPPYGIRAGAKKSGRKGVCRYAVHDEQRADHIPSTQHYPVEEVMLDLLDTSAKTLVM